MGIYNVEVTYPLYGEKMNATERRKWQRLNASWDLAAMKAYDYRQRAGWYDDYDASSEMYRRHINWSDRASRKRIALKKFCAEIDAKYAPKEAVA